MRLPLMTVGALMLAVAAQIDMQLCSALSTSFR